MEIEKEQKDRLRWIDLVRMLAISGAVLCHAVQSEYPLTADYIAALSRGAKVFCYAAFTLGRLGVPLFLMISGYLLLDRHYDAEKTVSFWKKSLLRLLICTWIWYAVYEVFIMARYGTDISLLQMLEDLLFLHPVSMSHAWYMPVILCIYLLIPFTADALEALGGKLLRIPMLVLAAFAFAVPTLKLAQDVLCADFTMQSQFYIGFSGGAYGFYLIFGYLVRKGAFRKIPSFLLAMLGIGGYLAGVLLQLWLYHTGSAYFIWYDNLFILIPSAAVFELCSRRKKIRCYPAVRFIARYAFPVYLIHNILRGLAEEAVWQIPVPGPVQVGILWALCMAGSLLIAFLIGRVPKVGKYILYVK